MLAEVFAVVCAVVSTPQPTECTTGWCTGQGTGSDPDD